MTEAVLGKTCYHCGEDKPLDCFPMDRGKKGGKSHLCRTCRAAYQRKRYADNEDFRYSVYLKHIKFKFGLTREDYETMLADQNHRCAICGCDPKEVYAHKDLRIQKLYVDRSRDKSKIRGLICHSCFHGLMRYLESPKLLEAAAYYASSELEKDAIDADRVMADESDEIIPFVRTT